MGSEYSLGSGDVSANACTGTGPSQAEGARVRSGCQKASPAKRQRRRSHASKRKLGWRGSEMAEEDGLEAQAATISAQRKLRGFWGIQES